jgi:hypothetical protein
VLVCLQAISIPNFTSTIKKVCYQKLNIFQNYYHAPHHNPNLSVALISQVCAQTMLLLLRGNRKHDQMDSKSIKSMPCLENTGQGSSKTEPRHTHTQHTDLIKRLSFLMQRRLKPQKTRFISLCNFKVNRNNKKCSARRKNSMHRTTMVSGFYLEMGELSKTNFWQSEKGSWSISDTQDDLSSVLEIIINCEHYYYTTEPVYGCVNKPGLQLKTTNVWQWRQRSR